jgi:hypothetical protein
VKYCRRCKTRGRDDQSHCANCGDELTEFGAGPSSNSVPGSGSAGATPEPTLALAGQIAVLQESRLRNLHRLRGLVLAALLVAFAFLFVGYRVYASTVLVYARLENVSIRQEPGNEQKILVEFDVVQPGKVSFERRSGGRRTEKVDQFETTGRKSQEWVWPSDPNTGIEFDVIYRGGWTRTFDRQRFSVSEASTRGAVDIVFLLDTTSSMTPFSRALKQQCIEFADTVRAGGRNVRLGLVGFGDVPRGEPVRSFPPTGDLQLFQSEVDALPPTPGGDEPESSVDALEAALALPFRRGAVICFIHITDADTHRQQELAAIRTRLESDGIVAFVVSRPQWRPVYEPLCVGGGEFFSIEQASFEIQQARFERILERLADSIISAIQTR